MFNLGDDLLQGRRRKIPVVQNANTPANLPQDCIRIRQAAPLPLRKGRTISPDAIRRRAEDKRVPVQSGEPALYPGEQLSSRSAASSAASTSPRAAFPSWNVTIGIRKADKHKGAWIADAAMDPILEFARVPCRLSELYRQRICR